MQWNPGKFYFIEVNMGFQEYSFFPIFMFKSKDCLFPLELIMKTDLFKDIENLTTKQVKVFR